jgi:hypothetical protein
LINAATQLKTQGGYGNQIAGGNSGSYTKTDQFDVTAGKQYTSGGGVDLAYQFRKAQLSGAAQTAQANNFIASGDYQGAISSIQSSASGMALPEAALSTLNSIYDVLSKQSSDPASVKQQEIAFLQTQPETLARDQSIENLISEISGLTQTVANAPALTEPMKTVYITVAPQVSADEFIASRAQIRRAMAA